MATYAFEFSGAAVQSGDRCEFFAGFPASAAELAGEADPLMGVTLGADRRAVYDNQPQEQEIAIVLSRNGERYARTNSLDLDDLSTSDDNEIDVSSLSQVLSEAELATFVPPTPFTEDNVTVTSASVDLDGGHLVLSGDAESDGWWFFDFTLEYEYTCDLVPVTLPLWGSDNADYLSIRQVDFNLSGANIIQDILLIFARGAIRSRLEDRLESDLNAAVREELEVVDGPAATVSDVDITDTSLTIELTFAGLEPLCPLAMATAPPAAMAGPASASAPATAARRRRMWSRAGSEVRRMRRIRDEVLKPSVEGRRYIKMFHRHRPEVARLMAERPDLADVVHQAVDQINRDVGREGLAQLTVPSQSIEAGRRAIKALTKVASPDLRQDLAVVDDRLKGKTELTVDELLAADET